MFCQKGRGGNIVLLPSHFSEYLLLFR